MTQSQTSGTPPAAAPIRCGVAGVGYLGQHHARIYAALEGAELAGIFETDDARAAEICARHNCRRFATLAELGAACDAVSVVVPTDRHAEVALPLLAAGCHLLIEKPLCATLAEAAQILAAAGAAGRIVQVGHIEHYNPVMSFLEQHVNDPRYLTADRLAPFNPRGTEVGVVLDLMIHDIGVVLQLVRSPLARIDAVGVNVVSPREDIANARLTFANGAVANLNTSRVSFKKVRELRVFQPGAYLSLDFMNQAGHLLRVGDGGTIFDIKREEIPIEKGEPLALELASFVKCVREHTQPKVGTELGRSALEVAIQITETIRASLPAEALS
ncbi:MAG: Gfo/Idh/MocA family oxidoreductase [Puniceicoccales bacterium]|jgi:predicted dehydrogenase|nr:Gfo/Idh/MocA family oxidoreductase [Puniceicoccales bacterium]